jgi:hypothetical protein
MTLNNKKLGHARVNLVAITCSCLIALILLVPSSNLQAEERPTIQVSFKLEGQDFEELPEETQAVIKSRAEEKVCDLAEERWGFLDWTNEQSSDGHSVVWNINLKVENKEIPNTAGNLVTSPKATLGHSGQIGMTQIPFPQTEENETIYPIGSMIPLNDAEALADDVSSQLEKQLVTLLESAKVKKFLQNIPIVERIVADTENSRIVVPVKTTDLRTDVDSVLRITFKRPDNWSGWLELETAYRVPEDGPHTGYIYGELIKVRLNPITFPTPTPWNPELPGVVDSASEIKVYMEEYNAILGAEPDVGGIASEPDMGGGQ